MEEALTVRLPEVTAADLREAWAELMKRARLNQHHKISREQLSVREHMSLLLRALHGRRFAIFEDLFDPGRGAPVLVVVFIALLELAREHLIEVTQAEAFAPIYVRLAYQSVVEDDSGTQVHASSIVTIAGPPGRRAAPRPGAPPRGAAPAQRAKRGGPI